MLKKFIKYILMALLLVLFFLIFNFFLKKELYINGSVMGTNYNIRVVVGVLTFKKELENNIKNSLNKIVLSFSHYLSTSEINYFNFTLSLDNQLKFSDRFINLIYASRKIYTLTNGLWDPTIGSLVKKWGFNDKNINRRINNTILKELLIRVGFDKAIIFCDDGVVKKGFSQANINFASIAKGFAVDQVANLLCDNGVKNFLIEIGGEIYAKGLKGKSKLWTIGLKYPKKFDFYDKICSVISLYDIAIATSGNYCSFFEFNDKILSHIINPITGYPVDNSISSITIMAENCTIADGLATVMMILNPYHVIKLVNRLPLIECYLITSIKNGFLKSFSSNGIKIAKVYL